VSEERREGPRSRGSGRSGHRLLPHTADLVVEAWAPTRAGCLEEAARGLVDSFARVPKGVTGRRVPVAFSQDSDEATLVAVLEEVIFALDATGSVPVEVELRERETRGVAGSFGVVPVDTLESHGPAPKGVSLSDLSFEPDAGGWRCRATIDV
jgi:SHS2 domain-containing protein